jgi:25S rRNA (uracil2843-N3)-methyltransferase
MGKKNGSYSRDYGKVVGKNSKDFPGWKGPGYVKKADSKPSKPKPVPEEVIEPDHQPEVSVELQQALLNVFKDKFSDILLSDTLKPLLQEVKTALYERDFARAFGKEDYLEAYSVRWSPSRALCYQYILVDIRAHLKALFSSQELTSGIESAARANDFTLHATCFGGGAAEVVAFGGFLRYLQDVSNSEGLQSEDRAPIEALDSLSISENRASGEHQDSSNKDASELLSVAVDLLLIDCAHWQAVVGKLQDGLTTPPPMSKYASAAAQEANKELITANAFSTTFHVEDALSMDQTQIVRMVGQQPLLLTLLFTLNELYTSSISRTTAFLLKLTIAAKPGTLLLVVDSPGSYSETTVGNEAKKYPMRWLLDHTLIETAKIGGKEVQSTSDWVKLVSEESKWFRIPEDLRYPIPLENMRCQIHLYRRV